MGFVNAAEIAGKTRPRCTSSGFSAEQFCEVVGSGQRPYGGTRGREERRGKGNSWAVFRFDCPGEGSGERELEGAGAGDEFVGDFIYF